MGVFLRSMVWFSLDYNSKTIPITWLSLNIFKNNYLISKPNFFSFFSNNSLHRYNFLIPFTSPHKKKIKLVHCHWQCTAAQKFKYNNRLPISDHFRFLHIWLRLGSSLFVLPFPPCLVLCLMMFARVSLHYSDMHNFQQNVELSYWTR